MKWNKKSTPTVRWIVSSDSDVTTVVVGRVLPLYPGNNLCFISTTRNWFISRKCLVTGNWQVQTPYCFSANHTDQHKWQAEMNVIRWKNIYCYASACLPSISYVSIYPPPVLPTYLWSPVSTASSTNMVNFVHGR